jgi:hypothetical protein
VAATVPTKEPESIRAGDTLKFTKSLADYSAADGWTLTYNFVKATGDNPFSFVATTSGSGYAITVAASTTTGWPAGDYRGEAVVSSLSGEVYTVWSGSLSVLPSVTQSAGVDSRSDWQIIYDNCTAVLKKTATREILNSEVDGVKLERRSVDEILKLRDRAYLGIQQENGSNRRRRILTQFNRAQ